MKFLETKYERKSFVISVLLFAIMFVLFFYMGLKYFDPPLENGIAINISTSDSEMDNFQFTEQENQVAPTDENQSEEVPDPVITDQNTVEDLPVVKKEVEKAPLPKPSKNTTDALSNLINSPKAVDKTPQNSGNGNNNNEIGDQEKLNSRMYSNIYAGSGAGIGLEDGSSWGLKGRQLQGHTLVVQKCDQSGKVVVQVWVNKEGKVTKAERAKGTVNAAKCLVDAAIETAKTFSWRADSNAPDVQVGFIVVNFKLG